MKHSYIYGPVPSRRLGYSLGVDIISFKNCSFNCVYCQLGETTDLTVQRKEYTPVKGIMKDIEDAVSGDQKIDYITFSGSGEPTLHSALGELISKVKKISSIPVAVLTNSSLINRSDVQRDLANVDVLLPTLCAVSKDIFKSVHRPHQSISIVSIIDGLINFRETFKGKIWLEIMLVKGINDHQENLKALRAAINRIRPDKIHLNTVIRPPSDKTAFPLSTKELEAARPLLGRKCEIIAEFKKESNPESFIETQGQIIDIIKRRPITFQDIVNITGLSRNELVKHITGLLKNKKIQKINHNDRTYYEAL